MERRDYLTAQAMLQARSPGGQLHLLAGGFFVGAGSVAPPVEPGFVVAPVVPPGFAGPVRGPVGRAVVAGADAAPVAGAAAADELVSVGMGTGTVG